MLCHLGMKKGRPGCVWRLFHTFERECVCVCVNQQEGWEQNKKNNERICFNKRDRTMEWYKKSRFADSILWDIANWWNAQRWIQVSSLFRTYSVPLTLRNLSETPTTPQQRDQHSKVIPHHSFTPIHQSLLALSAILAKCSQSCKIIAQHSTELCANLASQSHLFVSADQGSGNRNL